MAPTPMHSIFAQREPVFEEPAEDEIDMVNDDLYDLMDAGYEPDMEFYDDMDLIPEDEPLFMVYNEFDEPLLVGSSELPLFDLEQPPMEMLMDPMT